MSDPRAGGEASVRVGQFDGEPAVVLAAGGLEATFLPGLGLLGASLRHQGEELLALPGGVAGYRDGHVTGLPLLAPWANRLAGRRYRAAGVEVDLDGLPLHTDPGGLPIHGTLTAHPGWRLEPIFRTLAPGVEAVARTPGREGEPAPEEHGYLHCGPAGAGHFVKMVHNGIEYGIMAAYAEGLNLLRKANVGKRREAASAETAPLRDPEFYRYDIDTAAVAELWRRGSVVGSWLLDLTAHALAQDPDVAGFSGQVSDSGEGRWTVAAAVETGVPAHVLTTALYERFTSRGEADFAAKLLSAMRKEFGDRKSVV